MTDAVRALKRSLPKSWQRPIDWLNETRAELLLLVGDPHFPRRYMSARTRKWLYLEWAASSEGAAPKPFLKTFKPPFLTYLAICLHRGRSRRVFSIPPSARVKAAAIRSHASRFSTAIFVETGTFKGETVSAVANNFDRCITIELSETYWRKAKDSLGSNIECVHGDSQIELQRIVPTLKKPALFWLDAHSSGDGTVDSGVGPIFQELGIIFRSPIPHVILIDDARGHQVEAIRAAMPSSHEFAVRNDIIRITPHASPIPPSPVHPPQY